MNIITHECRVYESVDDRSVSLVMSQKSTENRTCDGKGYVPDQSSANISFNVIVR